MKYPGDNISHIKYSGVWYKIEHDTGGYFIHTIYGIIRLIPQKE